MSEAASIDASRRKPHTVADQRCEHRGTQYVREHQRSAGDRGTGEDKHGGSRQRYTKPRDQYIGEDRHASPVCDCRWWNLYQVRASWSIRPRAAASFHCVFKAHCPSDATSVTGMPPQPALLATSRPSHGDASPCAAISESIRLSARKTLNGHDGRTSLS